DYKTSREILKLIADINQKYHNTILMVTHNEAIKYMAHRIITLHDGKVRDHILNQDIKSLDELEW
ncbi:MAG: ABC transporter ATP-binding protein, partial [bacterium]